MVDSRKNIIVLSFEDAKLFACNVPWAAISIVSVGKNNPILSTNNRIDVLNMAFEDLEFYRPSMPSEFVFNEEKAKQILDFVNKVWSKIDCLMIHCHVGMSRSPAVAAAIEHIYYGHGSDTHWFEHKTPNMLVYETILQTNQKIKQFQ